MKRLVLASLALVSTLLPLVPAHGSSGFSHAAFTTVLKKYVDSSGKIDYKDLAADRAGLDAYVATLAAASPDSSPATFPTSNDQLAYWLNAYNASAMEGVINRPGLTSVKSVELSFFVTTTYTFGGKKQSLNGLETDVVRKRFHDPRVHMALNCQSAGCPRLRQDAYEGSTLDSQLDAGAKEFCTSSAKVYKDSSGVWHISQIFDWYKSDFDAVGGRIAFIDKYGGTIPSDAQVSIIPYDWTLSAQSGKGP